MNLDEAIETLRDDPQYADTVCDSYLDADWDAAASRYAASAEFAEVLHHVGSVDALTVSGRILVGF